MRLQIVFQLILVKASMAFFLFDIHRQHLGCFRDRNSDRDLPHEIKKEEALGTIEACVKQCSSEHFMYSGVQDGGALCFCGPDYGRHGEADSSMCTQQCTKDPGEMCGGEEANTVYFTGIEVPGPPANLELTSSGMTNMTLDWLPPAGTPKAFVTKYKVILELQKSFHSKSDRFPPKEMELSSNSTTVIGLQPGALYDVSVAAASEKGFGPPVSKQFWTEIGDPTPPDTPKLVRHEDGNESDDNGEIHIRFSAPEENDQGPITGFRVVVFNVTEEAEDEEEEEGETAEDPSRKTLLDYRKALDEGHGKWIAAEIGPDWFDSHDEFVVGDGRRYGEYLNYGPLPTAQDFHVTVGTVSTWNNVTKVAYAKVSHDQHHHDNIIIFQFHDSHNKALHDHDHHSDIAHSDHPAAPTAVPAAGPDVLAVSLSVAIVIFSVLVAAVVALYVFLRFCSRGSRARRSASNGDIQELTAQQTITDMESHGYDNVISVDDRLPPLESIFSHVWQIPRDALDLAHDMIGRGKFGPIVCGTMDKRGSEERIIAQIVADKSTDDFKLQSLAKEVELFVRCGIHPNIVQLLGVCQQQQQQQQEQQPDGGDAILLVMEAGARTMKQALLESRTLVHDPEFAEKHRTVSAMREEVVLEHLLGIARGMQHLALRKIHHRKLCARNVFLVKDVAKISASVTEYTLVPPAPSETAGLWQRRQHHQQQQEELDGVRWTAPELLKGGVSLSTSSSSISRETSEMYYSTKCDVWSYGCLMWEMTTLGATPYSSVKSKEVPARVARGLRLPMTKNVSDELYQLMLECWQVLLDERPSFEEIVSKLEWMMAQGVQDHINYSLQPNFEYETFDNDLEVLL